VARSNAASSDGLVHLGWRTKGHPIGAWWITCSLAVHWKPARSVAEHETITCLRCLFERKYYRPDGFSPVVLNS
jgi:hypothetical protein